MEVPVICSDTVQWCEVTVPSSSSFSSSAEPCAPLTENAASCSVIGDPPHYLIWRIHKDLPHALELVELSACKEFPKCGLRLIFRDTLCPFAFICRNQIHSDPVHMYFLYTLTVSGIAYLFKLRSPSSYVSGSVFPRDELIEFDLRSQSLQFGKITAIAAALGCLVVGRHDGSIGCYQLGILDERSQGFMHELRDDAGMGRLWGLVSRAKVAGAVQSLVISEVQERKLLFVLHVDGILRLWDLIGHARLLSHTLNLPELPGSTPSRLWVGDANYHTNVIFIAILYGSALEANSEMIVVYSLHINLVDKIVLSLQSSVQHVPLEEGRLVDLKITSDKLWLLKEDTSMFYDLFHADVNMEHTCSYSLQDGFVADQLFQGSEQAVDDLMWFSYSMLSPMKDQVIPIVSSIFLRRLLLPGVHQRAAMRASLLNYKRHLTDSEYQSLTAEGLKKEICSVVENEGVSENPVSVIYNWKHFCTHYFNYWRENSIPYCLFINPLTGGIGLIRKSSISLFRSLEDIELLIYGSFDDFGDFVHSGLVLPDDDLDCEILFDVLKCISSISQQVGKAATAVFFESLANPSTFSSEDIIPRLLKVLDSGYNSSIPGHVTSQFGVDAIWEKEHADHKSQRKFAIEMLLSLSAMCNKAATWDRVLDVIEKYVKYLIPCKSRGIENSDSKALFNINASLLVSATNQVARVMLESAFDILLLLGYMVNTSGQLHMTYRDISRIQLQLIPMIQEILFQWLILHLIGTTPSESPVWEDFSSRLSSLCIDTKTEKRSMVERIRAHDFTLACILLLECPNSFEDQGYLTSGSFPGPDTFCNLVRNFISWIVWGNTGEEYPVSFSHAVQLAVVLLRHGQFAAVENLFVIIEAHSCKKRVSQSVQSPDGEWCQRLLLLGFCLLVRAQCCLHGIPKERKVREAVRCFFRAAAGQGACPALHEALQSLSSQTGLQCPARTSSKTAWKLHYYQWVMQIFEQYSMSEGACQFALAALEQVDEATCLKDDDCGSDPPPEHAITVKGRLWANVFKFTLDLKHYKDSYCAIISNPDEESRHVCLRRFIIVLCEHGTTKVLCDGELPFVGLMEKVEQELVWKAERSEITAKPNPYKLLYAFQMYRHNWRRAASYMYRYCVRLKKEFSSKEHPHLSSALQERLNVLSAAINALHLVNPAYAWINPQQESCVCPDQHSPNKKARKTEDGTGKAISDIEKSLKPQSFIDIEKLENQYVLTSAQYLLALVNAKYTLKGSQQNLEDLLDPLVQANLYDMAFTFLLKFWKGSGLKRELERIFVIISQKCCPNRAGSSFVWNDGKMTHLLLPSSDDQTGYGEIDMRPSLYPFNTNNQWELLELYLEKYKGLHARLPFIVAETLLHTDPQMELPLWLVHMFKGGKRASCWGMTGQESDPASLFRLYVDYGRFTEATNLLLEYIESFASVKPADIIKRKKMSAIWFPYTTVERLWCQIEELRRSGHMVDQCDKLQKLLHGALVSHLKQVKVDSDDALSSALG